MTVLEALATVYGTACAVSKQGMEAKSIVRLDEALVVFNKFMLTHAQVLNNVEPCLTVKLVKEYV